MTPLQLAKARLPFVPRVADYALRKAKILRKNFPDVSLGQAREATARALGYPDWYALELRIKQAGELSPVDEDVIPDVARAVQGSI
jgi:hypothetical protein